MIDYRDGDLLRDDAEVLVNTVNCVGVMGKGIALAFKAAFPDNFVAYRDACARRELRPGGIFATDTGLLFGPRQIVNVATKDDWRNPSRLEWIEQAAHNILRHCEEGGFPTIAVPALGCANGGLPWPRVRAVLDMRFSPSKATFRIYRPIHPTSQA
jgi:O-acetyl-ADP-ribose deacetylase (regulator of RNase III)